jgi:arylsulfatase A-like enzyme
VPGAPHGPEAHVTGIPNLEEETLESLKIRYRDRVEPFTWLADRFGRRRSAMHAEAAVLIVAGPGIRHADLGRVNLIDIAPTLLRAAGIDWQKTDAGESCRLHGAVLDLFDPA